MMTRYATPYLDGPDAIAMLINTPFMRRYGFRLISHLLPAPLASHYELARRDIADIMKSFSRATVYASHYAAISRRSFDARYARRRRSRAPALAAAATIVTLCAAASMRLRRHYAADNFSGIRHAASMPLCYENAIIDFRAKALPNTGT
jgi:hypothetical protein